MTWETTVQDFSSIVVSYLSQSNLVVVILLDKGWNVTDCSQSFLQMLRLIEKPINKNLKEWLSPEDGNRLNFPANSTETSYSIQFHFLAPGQICYSLDSHIFVLKEGYLILGEKNILEGASVVAQLASLHNEQINMTRELHKKNLSLEKVLAEIKILRGLLPICSSCKKIRNDEGYWTQLEVYIEEHSQVEFSHGICPECCKILYPKYSAKLFGQASEPKVLP